jgi:hypothetical protein
LNEHGALMLCLLLLTAAYLLATCRCTRPRPERERTARSLSPLHTRFCSLTALEILPLSKAI